MAEGLGEGFGDEMKDVSKSMQNAIPSDFDIDMNGTVSDFNEVQTQAFDVTIPLSIDGVPLTSDKYGHIMARADETAAECIANFVIRRKEDQ